MFCEKAAPPHSDSTSVPISDGKTVTATVTNASIDGLNLKEGERAVAAIKSSSIILAVTL
ncbi:MAG: TOBE domain-containing protein [Candidatus Competibacter sp.]